MQDQPDTAHRLTAQGFDALKARRLTEAEGFARRALAAEPSRPAAHFLVGLLAIEKKDWRTGIAAFGSVTKLNPKDSAAFAHLAQLLQRAGHFDRADDALARALQGEIANPDVADIVGSVLTAFGRHREAEAFHHRAFAAEPARADFALNAAAASLFLGDDRSAAAALDPFIEAGGIPQAEWLFSTLRKARNRSRADRLMARAKTAASPQSIAFLAYAAGKEYEDCECWSEAFTAFEEGAGAKRSTIDFDEAAEVELFEALQATFNGAWSQEGAIGDEAPSPIFIIGQPRTGTTLVERIIASHSAVESAGELQQFGFAVRRLAKATTLNPAGLAAAWAQIDPADLGKAYLKSVAPMRREKPRFIDKLPRNFLYLPLIAKALPRAKIIHLVRDPLDACFASYKQLFAEAYPHSYDHVETARHYTRYANLMAHWRAAFPGAFLDVSYEGLVTGVDAEARRLVAFLDLPWEDACLRFHELDAPVATASAVQVREAAHDRSVGRALKYGHRLDPMRKILASAGLISPVVAKSDP
ncbi:MAG: sulfotransferase [Parvularculaceae bacterium]|nr:sulfotransferase [Parvularculaceae bacterium]